MAITKSLVPASLASGLDTDTDPKLGPKGLTRVEDGIYEKAGVISKRHGTTEIAAHSEEWLSSYDDIPVLHGNTFQVKVYDGSDFDVVDYIGYSTVFNEPFYARADVTTTTVEVALSDEVFASAYRADEVAGGSGIYARTWASATDRPLDNEDLDGDSDCTPRVIATGSNGLFLIYIDDSTKHVVYRSINTTTGAIGAAVTLNSLNGSIRVAAAGFRDVLDACYIGGSNRTIAISYIVNNGNDVPAVICFKTTSAVAAYYDEALAASTSPQLVACFQWDDDKGVLLTYEESGAATRIIYALGFDEQCNLTVTEDTVWTVGVASYVIVNMTGAAHDATNAYIYWTLEDQSQNSPAWDREVQYNSFEDSGGTGSAGGSTIDLKMGAQIYGKPWTDGTNDFIILLPHNGHAGVDISSQWTYIIIEKSSQLFGKFLVNGAHYQNPASFVTGSAAITDWSAMVGALKAESIYDNQAEYVAQDRVLIATATSNVKTVETEDVLIFPGSMPWEFDGQETYEQGFLTYPHKLVVALNGAGNLTADKTYSYVAVYEWTDRKDNRHQSSPSPAVTIATSAGNTKTLISVPTLTFTKRSSVAIVIYRTTGNGTIWYRCVTSRNDSTARADSIVDSISDVDLAEQEALYTTGGILENIQPPQFRVHELYQNRHFVVDERRPGVLIRYSKPIDKGFGIEHSDYLTLECNADGGRIYALEEFQDRLLIFKENSIYMTYGLGYDNLGTGNNYYDPSLLSNTVGCSNPKLILQTPQGVVFAASDENFYLINRKLQISAFGDPVQNWHSGDWLTSGVVMPENDQVLWLSNLADGYSLVFDWHYGMWSTWSQHQGTDIMWRQDSDSYILKKDDGSVHYQNTGYVDGVDGYSPELAIETGWYSFAGIAGFARLKRILIVAQNISTHKLLVKVGYNFDPYWTDVNTYDSTDLTAFDASEYYGEGLDASYVDQAYVLEVPCSRQKITSVRISISESPRTSTGASFEIAGIAFEVGKKEGPYRIGNNRVT